MDTQLPTRTVLKAQAKRLRATLDAAGKPCSHAQALEAIAHQWGARDWNTLSAKAPQAQDRSFYTGQRLSGQYLGHAFVGTVKAVRALALGQHGLTLRFDAPIDVVASPQFSAFRRQISCVVNAKGHSAQKTSDGQPHVVLDAVGASL
ncbi:glyoxalase superfamily protein [Tateyamaria pelophila]|uniref:glyoxalase superfamily protein n=1 Tax=Tateyamaria pelophila TaxID=328415 RepID=UPI001CBEFA51|nr:glyoxalase superfamily protein [Tateyamaria pelophila]